jgi:hypothetical protein
MTEKKYFFVVSIPNEEMIEYMTRLNSYISRQFPGKTNPYTLKPLGTLDNQTIAKVTIVTTRKEIIRFADSMFGSEYVFVEREGEEVEIVRELVEEEPEEGNGNVTKH